MKVWIQHACLETLLLNYRITFTRLSHEIFSLSKHKRSICGMQFRKENNNQRNTFRRRLKGIQTSQHLFAFLTFVCLKSPCWVASETSTRRRQEKIRFSRKCVFKLFCNVVLQYMYVYNQKMNDSGCFCWFLSLCLFTILWFIPLLFMCIPTTKTKCLSTN